MKKKRAAIYIRVSRKSQDQRNQLPEVLRLAKDHGLRVVKRYSERRRATAERPEFDRMRDDAHRGAFDVLIVWAIDRLGRSLIGNVRTVLELERAGVEVLSVRERWTGTEVRDLMIAIFSWVAQQESRRISERTKAGMARARRAGARVGRRRRWFNIDLALELRRKKVPLRKIARAVKVPYATLQRGLADPKRIRLHRRELAEEMERAV